MMNSCNESGQMSIAPHFLLIGWIFSHLLHQENPLQKFARWTPWYTSKNNLKDCATFSTNWLNVLTKTAPCQANSFNISFALQHEPHQRKAWRSTPHSNYSKALRCTFLGNGKTRVAQNSCNLSYLIRQRQDHQKTVLLKVFTT